MIVCHDRHNRQEINNSIQEENHHIQTNEEDHNIDLKKEYSNTYEHRSSLLTMNIT